MTNNLRFFRLQRGFTQKQLAELCNLTQNTISSIECGIYSPTLKNAFSLAEALCVPITSLFDFSDEHVIYNEVVDFDITDEDAEYLKYLLNSVKNVLSNPKNYY